ncbi:AAA family ATPase [Flavobacterium sp. 7A]|uniref:AAA family ATPase n=1 Tax=Flavobacterium sp. 7A TaxID=2940571 RepID=UPI002227C812|nr:AAA family ATPase [Flavobacterium sp. 7A]MCW2117782.1 putative ATP-dependent endonuclease of OLD family [Flavobacterium sp. 7A]
MKISKLHIEQYRHLENLDFDFTYPLDYKDKAKAGKPLDKICFIGQSATGKTGLLELIYEQVCNLHKAYKYEDKNNFSNEKNSDDYLSGIIDFSLGDINYKLKIEEEKKIPTVYYEILNQTLLNHNEDYQSQVIFDSKKPSSYFKANLISEKNLEIFTKNPIDILEKYRDEVLNPKSELTNPNILFDDNVAPEIWLYLLNDILHYRKNFTQIMTELVHKGYIKDVEKFRFEYEKWQKVNPNVLEKVAFKLNPLFEKLNLAIDITNTEYSVPIKKKTTDEIIPIQNTSTGTKGLLLSFLPLFKLDTKDSIILIDEPERSLYPDMQMDLMDHYKKLAPEAQFIVATHSPFIAASFEPEERFILYFDAEGKVAVRRGESPIGDDPNDILKNDFGLEFLMNKKGLAAFEKFKSLKKQIAIEENEIVKDTLLTEILQLANDYKF